IAVGTYHLDYHWTDTEKRAGTGNTDMVEPYHIPLDAMIPAGADNILCPGRSVSGEQLAMSSYRVMATCAQTGFGAGIAAALAARGGKSLTEIDRTALHERIVAGGQSLDLAHYGDYLRCLRFSDEALPLPANSAPQGANAPRRDIALAQTRDGSFVVARLTAPTRIELALRRRTKWKAWATLTSDTPLAAIHLGAGLRLAAQTADGVWGMLDAALPSLDAQRDKPVAAKFVPGPAPLLAAPDFADAAKLDGFQRLTGAACTLNDGETIRLAFLADGLVALARQRGALLLARIADQADLSSEPACFATSVGVAIAYRLADGTTRFWEGPIERFAAPQEPQPTAADLKGRPYKDHLILAAS
ncbi:MAG: FAD-dependent oxidoreductase, partial [Proteobacteria bacterium]|nr:FAD-dependent oxidoreductase [Pseudomonadota bacterium]